MGNGVFLHFQDFFQSVHLNDCSQLLHMSLDKDTNLDTTISHFLEHGFQSSPKGNRELRRRDVGWLRTNSGFVYLRRGRIASTHRLLFSQLALWLRLHFTKKAVPFAITSFDILLRSNVERSRSSTA